MDRQTLRDWVIRYNAQGIAGLSDRPHGGGAAPNLSAEERVQLSAWVRHGPNIAEHGVVRWRLRDLRDRIMARFFVLMDERSVGRILKTLTSVSALIIIDPSMLNETDPHEVGDVAIGPNGQCVKVYA
jgi:transposase